MCSTMLGFFIWVQDETQVSCLHIKHSTDLATFAVPGLQNCYGQLNLCRILGVPSPHLFVPIRAVNC